MSICLDLRSRTDLLKFSEEDVKAILRQYDRKPERLDEDIMTIRKWLKDQPHFPYDLSDRQIFAFLLMNKFSFEATKEKIDMMFTIRSLIPEFYQLSLKSAEMEKISKAFFHCALPKLSQNLNRVYINKCMDPSLVDGFVPVYSLMIRTMELRNDYDICNSDEYILDLENVSARMVTLASPMDIKKMVTVTEKVFSNRIAAFHVINLPHYAESIVGVLKMFLKPKIRERFNIHRDANKLFDYYPRDMLPKEYGGGGQSLYEIQKDWRKFLLDNGDHLEGMMKARVDENVRPMKLDNDELLGFHGNFRKLEVD